MSYRPSSMYHSTNNTSHSTTTSSSSNINSATTALQTRITAKRAELENLKQLRDLSATLASQMSALEQKLSTLRDGTEAVAAVLGNWQGVLGVIGMVGGSVSGLVKTQAQEEKGGEDGDGLVKEEGEEGDVRDGKRDLPVTLVRIPVGEAERGGG